MEALSGVRGLAVGLSLHQHAQGLGLHVVLGEGLACLLGELGVERRLAGEDGRGDAVADGEVLAGDDGREVVVVRQKDGVHRGPGVQGVLDLQVSLAGGVRAQAELAVVPPAAVAGRQAQHGVHAGLLQLVHARLLRVQRVVVDQALVRRVRLLVHVPVSEELVHVEVLEGRVGGAAAGVVLVGGGEGGQRQHPRQQQTGRAPRHLEMLCAQRSGTPLLSSSLLSALSLTG